MALEVLPEREALPKLLAVGALSTRELLVYLSVCLTVVATRGDLDDSELALCEFGTAQPVYTNQSLEVL